MKILLAIGAFYDRGSGDSKTDAKTLQKMGGLSHSAFYEALAELRHTGLVKITRGVRKGKYREYPTTCFNLVATIPPAPASDRVSVRQRGQKQSGRPDRISPVDRTETVRFTGQVTSQSPHPAPVSSFSDPKIVTTIDSHLGRKESGRFIRRLFREQFRVEVGEGEIGSVLAAAEIAQRHPELLGARAHALSRRLQARGVSIGEAQVRIALDTLVAVVDPTVQAALSMFGGEIVAVRPLTGNVAVSNRTLSASA